MTYFIIIGITFVISGLIKKFLPEMPYTTEGLVLGAVLLLVMVFLSQRSSSTSTPTTPGYSSGWLGTALFALLLLGVVGGAGWMMWSDLEKPAVLEEAGWKTFRMIEREQWGDYLSPQSFLFPKGSYRIDLKEVKFLSVIGNYKSPVKVTGREDLWVYFEVLETGHVMMSVAEVAKEKPPGLIFPLEIQRRKK